MVQDVAPGRALCEVVDTLDARQLAYVLDQAGEQLATIHAVAVAGFGRYHLGQGWDFTAWEAFAGRTRPDPASPADLLRGAGLSPRELAEAMAWMAEGEHYRCDAPVLCHMDFGAEHIFVDDTLHCSGVIDFGDFEGGPREMDLAFFELERGHGDCRRLLRGYGRITGALPADWTRRLDLTCVRLAWADLVHEGSKPDGEPAEWMVGVLRAAMRRLAARGG